MLESAKAACPIQLAQSGPIIESSTALSTLRERFREQNYVRLPKLIEPTLLGLVRSWIERGEFRPKTHTDVGREVCLKDPKALNLIDFLVNNNRFFRIVEQITECGRIGCFISRVYRMIPNSGHYDNWHRDLVEPRLVALSLNLSPETYSGGVLLLRDRRTQQILQEIENTGCGDAILFKLAPDLQHRVTDVSETAPKTAYAGWFCSEPDFHYELGKSGKSNDGNSGDGSRDQGEA